MCVIKSVPVTVLQGIPCNRKVGYPAPAGEAGVGNGATGTPSGLGSLFSGGSGAVHQVLQQRCFGPVGVPGNAFLQLLPVSFGPGRAVSAKISSISSRACSCNVVFGYLAVEEGTEAGPPPLPSSTSFGFINFLCPEALLGARSTGVRCFVGLRFGSVFGTLLTVLL